MNDRERFEGELHAAWEARDRAAWLAVLPVYADCLEEAGDPLQFMARALQASHGRAGRVKDGSTGRDWLWRLYFALPGGTRKAGLSRWPRNRRVNRLQTLGLPPTTLRCLGVEEAEGGGLIARFSVVFDERNARVWRGRASAVSADDGAWKPAATDADLDPLGFAAMFLPAGWRPAPRAEAPSGPRQALLFGEVL